MVLSYSAIAKPAADTPSVISIASPVPAKPAAETPVAGPSSSSRPGIHHLILDAGPLLSLAPLRHLAQTFHTTPMVLAELRDPRARDHWEKLGLSGVDVRVEKPSAEAMSKGL
jgi:RNA-binding protein NOB1